MLQGHVPRARTRSHIGINDQRLLPALTPVLCKQESQIGSDAAVELGGCVFMPPPPRQNTH